ncbi:MAG: NPCBM/NEW2 domain-containing protein, partial [Bacillota bacterium]
GGGWEASCEHTRGRGWPLKVVELEHMKRFVAIALGCLVFLGSWPAWGDPGWVVTREDFQQQPVALAGIDESGVRVMAAGESNAQTIGLDSFLQIERAAPGRVGQGKFVLMLLNGDRLVGEPTGYKDEQVLWCGMAAGEMKIPLKQASALVRAGNAIDESDQPPTEDTIILNNGDSVKGIIGDIEPAKVVIQANAAMEIPLESVRWIRFALAGQAGQLKGRAFRVHLNDDSFMTVPTLQASAESVTVTLADGGKRELPLAAVLSIEQLNGPVSWLSSRKAAQVVQIPYFGDTTWPTRMDRTVGGKPIQFGGRVFGRGIGVHAYSRIDYALDGTYEAFRTQYAMAQEDRRQYADVTVRIKVDGKVVHEQMNFRADVLSRVIVIDLPREAKMLTLEVDYGQANDTQDRFNWIEPALLRKKPATTQAVGG